MKIYNFLILMAIVATLPNQSASASSLEVSILKCEYLENPLAVYDLSPRLSWHVTSDQRNQRQSAYRILVASTLEKLKDNEGDLWDSKKVESDETINITYAGSSLTSRMDCYWKVMTWNQSGEASAWSEVATWKMGLLRYFDWKADWIKHKVDYKCESGDLYLPPSPYLRKEFTTGKKIKKAYVYASARGLYQLHLNGKPVGEDLMTPGWTDYRKRIYYNAYDITGRIKEGANVAGAVLSNGWYAGYVGYASNRRLSDGHNVYGHGPGLKAQIELYYEDGTSEIIGTNTTWKASEGPIRESDLQMGETYDATMELAGWADAGFDDTGWVKATQHMEVTGALMAYPSQPVRVFEEIKPKSVKRTSDGKYIFDMGRNFAGFVRLKVKGEKGDTVVIRHAEMLNKDGSLMTENLRHARATDTYILSGKGEEVWQPRFTFHGFQYVQLDGYPGTATLESVTGLAISSSHQQTGSFKCSDPLINQLYKNINTTQFANFIDVPTDCPQRDERLGWAGDIQIYIKSATFNANLSAFFKKFARDIDDSQFSFGAYPNYSPNPFISGKGYSTAWMDAGIIVPYNVYQTYGDIRVLRNNYEGMQKFMGFMYEASEDYLTPSLGNGYGDWLAVGEVKTDKDMISSLYYAYDASLMAEIALVLGNEKDAQHYTALFGHIKTAFVEKYMDAEGKMPGDTQTGYALALHFGLYPDDLVEKGVAHLIKSIEVNKDYITTGFLGVKHILPVLSQYGHSEMAYTLFTNQGYPSWLYPVVNGATSVWERWDSYTKEEGFKSSGMNSFSHYAYGSVCEWMFANAAGIEMTSPAYKTITFKPEISGKIDYVSAGTMTPMGKVRSNWERRGKYLNYTVEIPANVSAIIELPSPSSGSIRESGKKLAKVRELKVLSNEGGVIRLEAGSGKYFFNMRE